MIFFDKRQRMLRKMGYISDQNGIVSRYLREGNGWQSHLDNTKQYIMDNCIGKNFNSIGIFGSGWLLDVPMEELIANFEHIYLFDIVQPMQIKHKYRHNANVHFIEIDATGGLIEKVYEHCKNNKANLSLSTIQIPEFCYDKKIDIFVSLNILNQLDILLTDYIKQYYDYSENELIEFKRQVQQAHVDMLCKQKYCLITDYEEQIYNDDNSFDHARQLVYAQLPNEISKEWIWEFDKSERYYENQKVLFKVKAISNI